MHPHGLAHPTLAVAARKLLQRALRLNNHDGELWLAYFRFELVFLTKVRVRRQVILGEAPEEEKEEDDGSDDEDDEDDEEDDDDDDGSHEGGASKR